MKNNKIKKFTMYKSRTKYAVIFIFSTGRLIIATPVSLIVTKQKVDKNTPPVLFVQPSHIQKTEYTILYDFTWFYDSKGKKPPYVSYKLKGKKYKLLGACDTARDVKTVMKAINDIPSKKALAYTDLVIPNNHLCGYRICVPTYQLVKGILGSYTYTYWEGKNQVYYIGLKENHE